MRFPASSRARFGISQTRSVIDISAPRRIPCRSSPRRVPSRAGLGCFLKNHCGHGSRRPKTGPINAARRAARLISRGDFDANRAGAASSRPWRGNGISCPGPEHHPPRRRRFAGSPFAFAGKQNELRVRPTPNLTSATVYTSQAFCKIVGNVIPLDQQSLSQVRVRLGRQ
jgi:hypothetical protein